MTRKLIDLTTAQPNGKFGEPAKTAFGKVNDNFAELYAIWNALTANGTKPLDADNLKALATMRESLELVKQDNPKDFTTGRLITTDSAIFASRANYGSYYSSSAGVNIDNLPAGEVGLFSNGNAGVFPPEAGATFWWIETQRMYTGDAVYQEAMQYFGGAIGSAIPARYFRVRSNTAPSVWSTWQKIYTSGNIVGTVSQSGGVPTGAIIERGANSNGEYVRWADGTQIAIAQVNLDMSISSYQTFYFPASLASNSKTAGFASLYNPPSNEALNSFADHALVCTSSYWRVALRGSLVSGQTSQITLMAIGKWY